MSFDILEGHNFMNLTTYYPDGRGRTTPVWFAREGDTLYVVTGAESYKVKRLRGNPRCEVQPCDRAGTPLDEGPTAPGVASIHSPGTAAGSEANQALTRKYGLQKRLFDLMAMLRSGDRVFLVIESA